MAEDCSHFLFEMGKVALNNLPYLIGIYSLIRWMRTFRMPAMRRRGTSGAR